MRENITIFLVNLLAIIYFILEGEREAYYYACYPKFKDLHSIFTMQRLSVFIVTIFLFNYLYNSWIHELIEISSLILIFPFFHEGQMFETRHLLDNKKYSKEWRDDSDTSKAKINIPYRWRLVFLIIAVVLQITTLII